MENLEIKYEQLKNELLALQEAHNSLKSSYKQQLLEHQKVIEKCKQCEVQNLNLYQNAPVNYQLLDINGIIIDTNLTWLNSSGYIREEIIGRHISDFMTEESASVLMKMLPVFIKEGRIHDFESELILKNNRPVFVSFEGTFEKENDTAVKVHMVWTDITKRKQAEDANRIKEWAIESAIDAVTISNLDGNITYVNPAFLELWGSTSPEEVIGKPAVGFPVSEKKAAEVLEAVWQKGRWVGELEAWNKSGEILSLQVSACMVKDVAGRPVCMLASFSDNTKRKRAEILQAENEISYRELFNSVGDAIYILDEDATFLDVNEGAVRMYGYTHDELVGKNPLFVSAPGKNDINSVSKALGLAFAGQPQTFEFWGLRANGDVFPKEVRAINGTYFGKKVNIVMAQDITERKNAQLALQESERLYRELIELAVDGIMMGSTDGTIISANTYMQNLTGKTLDELIGTNIIELFSDDVLREKPLRFDLLKKGETVFSERNILRPDGTTVPIEMHTKMMPDGTYQSIYRDVTDRKKAEQTLRESEFKFKSLVESTSDMIWETNLDGYYTYVSPQFESLLGYTSDQVIGKKPFEFIADEQIKEIVTQSDSIVSKAIPFSSLVNKYLHKDGRIMYFETSGVPVFDQSGKVSGYRGVSRDISKRHHAEQELHKLSSVVYQSPNTVIITDLDGKIEYINPAGCVISGYSMEEIIGQDPSIFNSGEAPDKTYNLLWDTIKSGNEWRGIFYNKKKNGELYWESAFIVPLKDTEGNTINYLGIKEDISHRIQAENALKESEERYRELFEASPDAIILADIETGMLFDANSTACELLGRSLEEIKQLHQTMIHPPRNEKRAAETFTKHATQAKQKVDVQPIESIIIRADGTEIPVEVLANSMTLNGRNILQGVFRNITERKLAEKELLKAKEKAEAGDKLKSAFLNNISHELRTPLNGIIGFSEMITQMDSTEEDRIEFSKMIKRSSTRLINTITSYMDISMIVSGIIEINKRSFSLSEFLEKINEQTLEICSLRDLPIDIIKKDPGGDINIFTDQLLLTKIFSHLIDNAIKFTKEGSITFGYENKNGVHQFSVSDTGKGIPKESLSVIFEVFMQADLSTSRGYEGSGVGLSIAQGFVKLLGGEIWVESNDNEGSTFFFTLPEIELSDEDENGQDIIKKAEPKKEPVILVAEDEDSNYKYLEIVLRKAEYKVLRATNGFETVEMCRSHPEISVLLMDLKMPGMDGFEATRQIRRTLPELYIIALSAYVSSHDENAAMSAGCNEYIVKPVSKTKLLDTLKRIIQLQ